MSVDISLLVSAGCRAAAQCCAGMVKGAIACKCGHSAVGSALGQSRSLAAHGNHVVGDTGEGTGRVKYRLVFVHSTVVGEDIVLDDRVGAYVSVTLLKGCNHLLDVLGGNERRSVGEIDR